MACDLYCCFLPQCEALRICRSGFPIATFVTTALGRVNLNQTQLPTLSQLFSVTKDPPVSFASATLPICQETKALLDTDALCNFIDVSL